MPQSLRTTSSPVSGFTLAIVLSGGSSMEVFWAMAAVARIRSGATKNAFLKWRDFFHKSVLKIKKISRDCEIQAAITSTCSITLRRYPAGFQSGSAGCDSPIRLVARTIRR